MTINKNNLDLSPQQDNFYLVDKTDGGIRFQQSLSGHF